MSHSVKYPRITEGTQRLEAFSDGVFAISMTFLAASLMVTHPVPNSFANTLSSQWPQYLSFFISFVNVGIVWTNHHEMFRFIIRSNHIFLLINLFLLMFIVLMPYATTILGEYLRGNSSQASAAAFYSGTLLGMAVLFNAVWLYAVNQKFVDERCSPEAIAFMTRSHLLAPLVFGIAFVFAFIWYPLTLIIVTLASMLFFLPNDSRPISLPQTHFKQINSDNQRRNAMQTKCLHLDQIKDAKPSANGCEECLRMGDTWVHLRECLTCGHVGCCDSSKNKHATQHFRQTHHPLIQSFEPGEDWLWCYEDEVMMKPEESVMPFEKV